MLKIIIILICLFPSLSCAAGDTSTFLNSLELDQFFPDNPQAWKLVDSTADENKADITWQNSEQHEIELKFRRAVHTTLQNVYLELGKKIDEAVQERGGQIAIVQEFYALAFINESKKHVSVYLLYGTIEGAYLWKYKIPLEEKSNIDKFVERLTFRARKQQYEKALKSGNIVMGRWGNSIHEYARLLAKTGDPQAEIVYADLLRTSPANYEAHMEFASITKDKDKISESTKIVRRYAEDERLLNAAARILNETPPDPAVFPLVSEKDNGLRVILIPLPPYNPWLLREIAETYEAITTIPVNIRRFPENWQLPPPTRSGYRRQLEQIASRIWPAKADFSDWSLSKLQEELMKQAEREGPQAIAYFKALYKKIEEESGQWDASPLVDWLSRTVSHYRTKDAKTMYVGITAIDIYWGDSNFVFSSGVLGNSPAAILSYARMKAAFTGEAQSRRRLVERAAKELVPPSLQQLAIPRSIDPSCPYSYADGLNRTDEKTLKLSGSVMEQILKLRQGAVVK